VTEYRDWAAEFDRTFTDGLGAAQRVETRIWTEVYGEDYPAELEPYSYISRTELRRFAVELRVSPDEVFADLACGQGGPGLWVARETGARLVGVDLSKVALEAAARRAASMGLAEGSRWVEGTFEATGLEDASLDGAMSVDALLFTPDKGAATREFARIVRPGGRLVFTTFDYSAQPAGRPPQVGDHRPLLEEAGFDVLAYDETDDWHHRLQARWRGSSRPWMSSPSSRARTATRSRPRSAR
jgi:SAM-dependent methyltransferase